MPFQIVVLTRSSAKWLLPFLDAYRTLGIEPLYVVDPRTQDETLALLERENASFALFEPRGDFVEAGSLAFAASQVKRPWTLRLDDDEFPSAELLRWARETGCSGAIKCWGIPRHNAYRQDGRFLYSKKAAVYHNPERRNVINPQFRLYMQDSVAYVEEIHTPGFAVSDREYAPGSAYIAHFDALLRTMTQRVEKIRRYEKAKLGFGWAYCDQYLPELVTESPDDVAEIAPEFHSLIEQLPLIPREEQITLSCEEIREMRFGQSNGERHAQRHAFNSRHDRAAKFVKVLPAFLVKKAIAEFICTMAVLLRPFGLNKPLYNLGSAMFERAMGAVTGPRSV